MLVMGDAFFIVRMHSSSWVIGQLLRATLRVQSRSVARITHEQSPAPARLYYSQTILLPMRFISICCIASLQQLLLGSKVNSHSNSNMG